MNILANGTYLGVGVPAGAHLLFAIVCCILAGQKNRSKVGWFFGGFFLGLIGLIIIACLKPKQYK